MVKVSIFIGYCHNKIQDLNVLVEYCWNHDIGKIDHILCRNHSSARILVGICSLEPMQKYRRNCENVWTCQEIPQKEQGEKFFAMSHSREVFNLTSADATETHGNTAPFALVMHATCGGSLIQP